MQPEPQSTLNTPASEPAPYAHYPKLLRTLPLDERIAAGPTGPTLGGHALRPGRLALALEALARAGAPPSVRDLLRLDLSGLELDVETQGEGLALIVRNHDGQPVHGTGLSDLTTRHLEERYDGVALKGWCLVVRHPTEGHLYALYRREGWASCRRMALDRFAARLVEPGHLYPAFERRIPATAKPEAGERSCIVPVDSWGRRAPVSDVENALQARLRGPFREQVNGPTADVRRLLERGRVSLSSLATVP